MGVHHTMHPAAVQALLHNPAGGVARDMLRRGIKVQSAARRNLAGASGAPRRIDTGLLRSSVYVRQAGQGARVGSPLKYAGLVHSGTGLFGPRHAMIRSRRGRLLAFTPKGGRGVVFARAVRGMTPNRFLADALPAAKD